MSKLGLRVGTDLCSVRDVRQSVETFGDRYLCRVFTPGELAECQSTPDRMAERLAARFAAKEAAMKVLDMGDLRPDWRSVEICRQESGQCELRLTGTAARMARDAGLESLAMSMSHELDMAIAVVVATSKNTDRGNPVQPEEER